MSSPHPAGDAAGHGQAWAGLCGPGLFDLVGDPVERTLAALLESSFPCTAVVVVVSFTQQRSCRHWIIGDRLSCVVMMSLNSKLMFGGMIHQLVDIARLYQHLRLAWTDIDTVCRCLNGFGPHEWSGWL